MKRGFGSPKFDRSKLPAISSLGGKAAHKKGTAHEWTSEEAREAGKKGGLATRGWQRRRELAVTQVTQVTQVTK